MQVRFTSWLEGERHRVPSDWTRTVAFVVRMVVGYMSTVRSTKSNISTYEPPDRAAHFFLKKIEFTEPTSCLSILKTGALQ